MHEHKRAQTADTQKQTMQRKKKNYETSFILSQKNSNKRIQTNNKLLMKEEGYFCIAACFPFLLSNLYLSDIFHGFSGALYSSSMTSTVSICWRKDILHF